MAKVPFTEDVQDSVPKIDQEVAVGEDLKFQRRWWRFETGVWVAFAILVLLGMAGVFGRGPVAKAHAEAADQSISIAYDHIQRTGTPSDMTVQVSPSAVKNGKIQLSISESLIRKLGAQRIAPQPEMSAVGKDGLTYTFPAADPEGKVVFALEPSGPGVFPFSVKVPGSAAVQSKILVMP